MNDQPTRSSKSFPVIAAVVLFAAFALMLALVLPRGSGIDTSALRNYQATNTAVALALLPTATPTRTPTPTFTPTMTPVAAASAEVALAAYNPADIAAGETLFQGTCSACHGMDARGVQNLGKNLIDSEFATGLSDADLLAFIKVGRQPWDPGNTTGVAMPANGGNPALTDDDLMKIIAYVRSLEAAAGHTLGGGGGSSAAPANEPTQPPAPTGPQPTDEPFKPLSLDALSGLQPTPIGGAPEATEEEFKPLSLDALSGLQPTPIGGGEADAAPAEATEAAPAPTAGGFTPLSLDALEGLQPTPIP